MILDNAKLGYSLQNDLLKKWSNIRMTSTGITRWSSLFQEEMKHPLAKKRYKIWEDICKLFKNKKTFYKLNLIGNGTRKGVMEMLYILWVYKFIKANWILPVRPVHFTEYKFYNHFKKKKCSTSKLTILKHLKIPKNLSLPTMKDQTPNSLLCLTLLQFSFLWKLKTKSN